MKKILILISMVALSHVVIAQQGSWYLGGLVGYRSTTDEVSSTKNVETQWAFGPEFGTFLKDDIQLGLVLGLIGSSIKNDGTKTLSSFSMSPTIYGRKFFKITDNFSTFAGLYVNIISGTVTNEVTDVETKGSGFGAKVGVGVAYALSPRFIAVGQYGLFGYSSIKTKVDGTETGTVSTFEFGVNTVGGNVIDVGAGVFNIGIYYTIKQ
jgi:hypothetical protein